MSTELEVKQSPEIEALIRQQDEAFDDVSFQVPILKIAQSLTAEVVAGDAEAGDFVNTLTGESYGSEVEFIIAYVERGRAAAQPKGKYFVSVGEELIPESWGELLGEEWVGTRFDEHPDADEQYKKRVNAGEIEWGSGPLITTTFNYTGYVLPPAVDGEDAEEPFPVRLTFKRTTKSAHDKIQTLKKATLRNKAFWDVKFELSTSPKTFGRNQAHIVNVKKGAETTPEQRQLAIDLATAVTGGRVTDNAEAAEAPAAKPADTGGLDIG